MFARLLLLFIIVPVVELALLLKAADVIGPWPTLGIIVVTAIIGASLTKRQGASTMAKAQAAMAGGKMPHAEVLDALMIVIAGAVLLTPGFLTDVFGFSLLFPPVRAAVRKRLVKAFKNRVQIVTPGTPSPDRVQSGGSAWADDDNVIEAEVIDDEK
jgi:UPF0716 protein FxsA